MLASELYAISEGKKCEGKRECHWCGAACEEKWLHDEPPPLIGVRRSAMVARPNNPWICTGCWLWRRQRITINLLDGTQRDVQTPAKHCWLISDKTSLAFYAADHRQILFKLLTVPVAPFSLILRTPGNGVDVHIQMAVVNEMNNPTINTPMFFTLDNIKHQFTLYELDEALKHTDTGKEPGVRVLAKIFDGLVPKVPDGPAPVGHPYPADNRSLNRRASKK